MAPTHIDDISIVFSDGSLLVLNLCLGFIMFGVALGIDTSDFAAVGKAPRAVTAGALSQFLLLPAITAAIVFIARPHPAIALGMILVAACPGGNISNFISSLARADVALSVSLTAISTVVSPLITPLNFEFWSGLFPELQAFRQQFELSFTDMLRTVLLLLLLPLALGMWFKKKRPNTAKRMEKHIRYLSILILIGFIVVALMNNLEAFYEYLYVAFFLVLVHNAAAFATGYFTGRAMKLSVAVRRTLTIETGIQNSGLALIIIFNFFGGNGGMAIIAAWWGIWHIGAGLVLAYAFQASDSLATKVAKH
ncbi:MAG TPA: bile acid:sodium symporter family protein [Cryomorphaceae bacterium]|nr:bile acid:sodium symporter family protein [Cryomorphaceae bacterium]